MTKLPALCCVLLVFLPGCSSDQVKPSADYDQGYKIAVVAFDTDKPLPAPGSKCETCDGTGKVGDGRVFVDCRDCGGDGIVGDQPVEIVKTSQSEPDHEQPIATEQDPQLSGGLAFRSVDDCDPGGSGTSTTWGVGRVAGQRQSVRPRLFGRLFGR